MNGVSSHLARERRRLRYTAGLLLGLSLLQFLLSFQTGFSLRFLSLLALGFSFLKCRSLVLDLMGLRGVAGPWRALMFGWLFLVLSLLLLSFWLQVQA